MMKSKFLAMLAALTTTSVAMAQTDTTGGNILDSLGGAVGGLGVAGLVIVGLVLWWFFFRGSGE